jgi:hypothetical protein
VSIKLYHYDEDFDISFEIDSYANNDSLAICMTCGLDNEPYGVLTVNLEDFPCTGDCAFVDTNNFGDVIIDWIVQNDLGELTGRIGFSGYCVYPEVRFNLNKIKEHEVN